jgi:hypothetical protein
LPIALAIFIAISVSDVATTQQFFISTTYYLLMATVLCWAGTYLHGAQGLRRETAVAWLKENWPGLVIALVVTVSAGLSIQPALRILSDEANLVGTSKNFFASKTATFTVSGKNYYDSYWDIDVAIDRRPTLFPFLVSLVHAVCGYSYKNAFVFNLLLLPAFVFVSYRLAKSLGGATLGVVTGLLVSAHPMTLIAVRSGGFDFLATFFALLVLKSLLDFTRDRSPAQLAILWMNLCLFAEVRYETALFLPALLALLLLFRMISWSTLAPYAFVYVLTPLFLLPRLWQSILRGNIPEQEPGTVTFSFQNFIDNAHEYFEPVLSPFGSYPSHSAILIALGLLGCLLWFFWAHGRVRSRDWQSPELRFAVFVAAWMLLQAVISFTYVWGRAQFPSSARLVMAIDTFFSFGAAYALTALLRRAKAFVPVLLAAAVFVAELPIASQHRMLNRLTQTRESATIWSFFERLHEERILIVTNRPNLFTIMNYGAMNFETAKRDPYLFTAFDRHLFYDIYVIQQIQLATKEPLPGYEIWHTRKLDTVLEFQNDANVLVRVSKVAR